MQDFNAKARRMTSAELDHALRDIAETLALYRDAPADHPYARKLWDEWDACLDERRARTFNHRKGRGYCNRIRADRADKED